MQPLANLNEFLSQSGNFTNFKLCRVEPAPKFRLVRRLRRRLRECGCALEEVVVPSDCNGPSGVVTSGPPGSRRFPARRPLRVRQQMQP
jgi:hypothetical protein